MGKTSCEPPVVCREGPETTGAGVKSAHESDDGPVCDWSKDVVCT